MRLINMLSIFKKKKDPLPEPTKRPEPSKPPEQLAQLRKHGITVLPVTGEKVVDIVFIPGLTDTTERYGNVWSHPDRTWTHANGFSWPDALARAIPAARIMVYKHDLNVDRSIDSINNQFLSIAKHLLNEIEIHRQEDAEGMRPLFLIGHSIGGIILKRAVLLSSSGCWKGVEAIYQSLKLAIFFGTPNAGSQLSRQWRVSFLRKAYALVVLGSIGTYNKIVRETTLNGGLNGDPIQLLDLADDFAQVGSLLDGTLEVYSFFETRILLGTLIVEENAAKLHVDGERDLPVPGADHISLVRYADENNAAFQTILARIRVVIKANDPYRPPQPGYAEVEDAQLPREVHTELEG